MECLLLGDGLFGGVFADVFGDLHGAEVGAAHGAEVGALGSVLRQRFVVVFAGGDGIEGEVELVFPAELEAGFAQGVVAVLSTGVAFGEVGGVGGEFVGDDSGFDVFLVREAEVFLGGDVAEHGAAIPADHGGADAAGDVVVAGGDVGGERPESVEGGLVAPFELLGHVFLDHVHGDVSGAFVHDLDAFGPGALGEFALHFEFAELGFVIGVGDGAGAEAVADAEADVVGGHDVADVVPMGVEEVFLVMGEAPLGHDAAATADDAGHAGGGHGDEAEEDTGVDGEVIDALLGLLDEGVAEEFPGEVFGLAVHFFERLINGHGADGHGRIPQDPFTGGVDVLAGGEVHDGVGTPLGGPAHFFDLFLDAGGDGAVPDVGVDLHEEVPANDHRLELGVIDVRRDDGAACGDFATDELGGDFGGDALGEALEDAGGVVGLNLGGADVLLVEVVADDVVGEVGNLSALHVFADGDEFHLGGDDALLGIPKLGDRMAGGFERAAAFAIEAREFDEAVTLGGAGELGVLATEVAVVLRLHFAAIVDDDVVASFDPSFAESGQAFGGVAFKRGIAPRAGAVIDTDGSVLFDLTVERFGRAQRDLAHGHPDILVNLALDIHAVAVRELFAGVGLEGFFGGDHGVRTEELKTEDKRLGIKKPCGGMRHGFTVRFLLCSLRRHYPLQVQRVLPCGSLSRSSQRPCVVMVSVGDWARKSMGKSPFSRATVEGRP